jgi:hypothetical protein
VRRAGGWGEAEGEAFNSFPVAVSIVKAVTNGTATLGVLTSAASQAKTVIPMLGIVFIAAGGGLVLWGLFKMFGGSPLSKYWE